MKIRYLSFFVFFSLIFTSCSNSDLTSDSIDLSKSLYYFVEEKCSSVTEIQNQNNNFKKLEHWGRHNLAEVAGVHGNYVWLKTEFEVPSLLKNSDLGVFVSYIHFAEETYINGIRIGQSGIMPDGYNNEVSSMYESHFYTIHNEYLKFDEPNTLLIKVYAKGNAEISGKALIGNNTKLKKLSVITTFLRSRIYLLLVAGPFASFVLFFSLFLSRRKKKNGLHYLFAIQNLFTVFLLSYFFSSDVPWYVSFGIPHIWYTKITLCFSIYFVTHFVTLFQIYFITGKVPRIIAFIKYILLFITMIVTITAKDLPSLMAITPYMIIITLIQFGIAIFYSVHGFFVKSQRNNAIVLNIAFSPLIFCIILDLIIRLKFDNMNLPFLTIFGHQLTNLIFIVNLTTQMNHTFEKNEYLNENLAREVQIQTVDITFANERLEQELNRSKLDLEMASVVQKKFLPLDYIKNDDWELSVSYEPLSKVSGDLYDYYLFDNILSGFALFDASGHGVAASLVTMLSKNIIFKSFRKAVQENQPVSEALIDINNTVINAKGSVENYLTGLLFKIGNVKKDGSVDIQMASAGHPYPVFYSTESNDIEEILLDASQVQCGAIGIKGIAVSFPDINLVMHRGDVLVAFSDGLLEAVNDMHVQFGRKNVERIVKENHDLSAGEIKLKLLNGLNGFLGETIREDDVSIIVLKKL